MSGGAVAAIIGAVILVLAVLAIGLVVAPQMRRRRLRDRFGPEYSRAVDTAGSRREAEAELAEREKRHAGLDIRDLEPAARDRYAREWRQVQEHFVDAPERATGEADRLITVVMAERGYPTEGYEQQAADLSVEHARTLEHYRHAHGVIELVARQGASTEDLRQAMVHYRAVFEDLVGADLARLGVTPGSVGTRAATEPRPDQSAAQDDRADDTRADDTRAQDTRAQDTRAQDTDPGTPRGPRPAPGGRDPFFESEPRTPRRDL